MARFSVTAKLAFKINKKQFKADYEEFVLDAVKKAGRAAIRAMYPLIPVRTGMARGSLLAEVHSWRGDEGDAMSFFKPDLPITPVEFDKKYYVYPPQRHISKVTLNNIEGYKPRENTKTPAIGWIPKDAESGADLSIYEIDRSTGKNMKITFNFDSGVKHLTYNDFSTWHSLERGRNAFAGSIMRSFKKMPNLKDYMEYASFSGGRYTNLPGKQRTRKVSSNG